MKDIRVIEIRQASNGWVITCFEKESSPENLYLPMIYRTSVATSPESVGDLVSWMCSSDSWQEAVFIPPARKQTD